MSDPTNPRVVSLDALRGFDMFWIVGGREIVVAAAGATGWGWLTWIQGQCYHPEWHGFTAWDLIFPLFLFLAGVSLPFSLAARRARGDGNGSLSRHALQRGFTLVFLGVVYNGLLAFDFANLRYASVLGRIGLAWMLAALLVIHTSHRTQLIAALSILVGYAALLVWSPVPGVGPASLEPGATFTDWFDRTFLPGRLHRGDRDPEGLLATLPAVATALSGVFAGRWLRSPRAGATKTAGLLAAGVATLTAGWLWSFWLPLNKNLWTSSFTLWTSGASAVLLALFYFFIDVLGWRRLAFPFVILGANAITIYLLHAFVDFEGIASFLFANATPRRLHPALLPAIAVGIQWALCAWLYRKRLFLRV